MKLYEVAVVVPRRPRRQKHYVRRFHVMANSPEEAATIVRKNDEPDGGSRLFVVEEDDICIMTGSSMIHPNWITEYVKRSNYQEQVPIARYQEDA